VLERLQAALRDERWSDALELALWAWRETHAPGLADIADAVTLRCNMTPIADGSDVHARWIAAAHNADAQTRAALLASIDLRAYYLDGSREDLRARWRNRKNPIADLLIGQTWMTNLHERLALVLEWPDDPRVARFLVERVRRPELPYPWQSDVLWDALADRVGAVGDQRHAASLAKLAGEPRGGNQYIRDRQVRFALRAGGLLATKPAPRDPGALLAECVALVVPPALPPPPEPPPALAALWAEVAANPDDVHTRAILGDALVQIGDLRGDVIVLQCNAKRPGRPLRSSNRTDYDGRVKTLVRKQWEAWLGDLALVLARRHCEFRCGMLEVVRVGLGSTPSWAYGKGRDHRELVALHTVRPGWVTPDDYATFVAALTRPPRTLGVVSPRMLDAIVARTPRLPLHAIEILTDPMTPPNNTQEPNWLRPDGTLKKSLDTMASLAPDLVELHILDPSCRGLLPSIVPDLPKRFRKLGRIAIAKTMAIEAGVLGLPLVEVV
jgi:hypothetical protein